MTDPIPPSLPLKKKRGPKPQADLDAVTRVGAEFRALLDGPRAGPDMVMLAMIVDSPLDVSRFATACAGLTDEQRRLASALCSALSNPVK